MNTIELTISSKLTKKDQTLIRKIVKRFLNTPQIDVLESSIKNKRDLVLNPRKDEETYIQALEKCHAGEEPLLLEELLDASDFNLIHDVYGIERHITEYGKLDCFSPRYADNHKRIKLRHKKFESLPNKEDYLYVLLHDCSKYCGNTPWDIENVTKELFYDQAIPNNYPFHKTKRLVNKLVKQGKLLYDKTKELYTIVTLTPPTK